MFIVTYRGIIICCYRYLDIGGVRKLRLRAPLPP